MFAVAQHTNAVRVATVGLVAAFLAICAVSTATGPASAPAALADAAVSASVDISTDSASVDISTGTSGLSGFHW
ncbi:MAG: hypothetical protein ABI047_00680 [Jatrophihabitantaceae bacterium]